MSYGPPKLIAGKAELGIPGKLSDFSVEPSFTKPPIRQSMLAVS